MSNPLPSAARAAAFALLVAACSQVPTGPGETVSLPPERLAAAGAAVIAFTLSRFVWTRALGKYTSAGG